VVGAFFLVIVPALREGASMNAKSRAQGQLELYQRYSGIARGVTNSEIRLAYEGLARQALLYAAKLDPAAVANATEITMAKPT
jgi:hypothetical protein